MADVFAGAPASASGLIFDYFGDYKQCCEELAIDSLLQSFLKGQSGEVTSEQFLQFAKSKMTLELCSSVEKQTTAQA